jgi:formamidopyrimidine-DNA glycosylase
MRRIHGGQVVAVRVDRRDVIEGDASEPALLVGQRVIASDRRGKQLALMSDAGRVLVIQLGMTGQLVVQDREAEPSKHTHVRWDVQAPTGELCEVHFRDPRRFGGLTTLADAEALATRWSALGPDALTITGDTLIDNLAGSRRAIKAALLDQGVLAGVGNIYADEALFRAGIAPKRLASRLDRASIERLAQHIRAVLGEAVAAGGSTLRDYINADFTPGAFALSHAVYGRAGQACVKCRTVLKSSLIAQRMTVWCPVCQVGPGRGMKRK